MGVLSFFSKIGKTTHRGAVRRYTDLQRQVSRVRNEASKKKLLKDFERLRRDIEVSLRVSHNLNPLEAQKMGRMVGLCNESIKRVEAINAKGIERRIRHQQLVQRQKIAQKREEQLRRRRAVIERRKRGRLGTAHQR